MMDAIGTNNKVQTFSFTEAFIGRLTDVIVDQYVKNGRDLSRLAIIFGGKRPALFLKRELSRRIGREFISPQFLTIDELIRSMIMRGNDAQSILDLDHSHIIYQLAKKSAPQILKGRETFAQFLPWTVEIIKFIDHLDLELVPSKSLQNIEANARIGYGVPKDINRLLEHISVVREAYHEYLERNKIFSRGFQYWWAARHISDIQIREWDEMLFCNFFYLHRSESVIMEELFKRGQARFFFQGDERRWPALKRLSKTFGVPLVEGEEVPKPKFDLKLYAAVDEHVQASLVRDILKKIKDPQKTVIVLPDTQALIPLLSEIASVAKDFNVSMGYPLKRSSLFSLLDFIFQVQLSARHGNYYARDYLKVLRHPFVKNLKVSEHTTVMRVLIHKLEEILTGQIASDNLSGKLFLDLDEIEEDKDLYAETLKTLQAMSMDISKEDLKAALHDVHQAFFATWASITDFDSFAGALTGLLKMLAQRSFMEAYPLNTRIAQRMFDLMDEFKGARFATEHFPQEEIFRIFKERIGQEMVSFQGSPLKGLQILGLFETRSLSFENVIVLDVNEGILPHLKIYEPLIPREVMIKLNLDRLELEEEIQRYQFMRLLSSAKNVHLIYREGTDKEKSRFVEELVWDKEKDVKTLNPIPVIRPGFEVKVAPYKKQAAKTPAMVEFLKTMRFSASSVNTYLRNPYEFYQNYVLGLREKEDLLDEPENRQVGVFIHGLLEETYKKFDQRAVTIDEPFRRYFMNAFEERFAAGFGRSMSSDSFLLKSVMESRMNRFLDVEEERQKESPTKVLFIEKRFEDVVKLPCGDVRFVYQVDRVDEYKDGTVMIIDYKTGSVDPMPKGIEKIATLDLSRESIRDHVKSFQIPLYVHYLNKQYPGRPINAAFYNLRTMTLDQFFTQKLNQAPADIDAAFMRALDFILSEIFDPRVPFVYDDSMIR